MDLKSSIRTIRDYPKPGIIFRDVTTLISDARSLRMAVDQMVQPWAGAKLDTVAGTEARGFIMGGAVAHQLSVGFTAIRKQGKLPAKTLTEKYTLEYGDAAIEIHVDAVREGDRVLLVDDLVATGGTAEASIRLLQRAGATVVGAAFIIDLPYLGGAKRIEALGVPVQSLVSFEDETVGA
ncbi:MAG: adenine phosphoribosyltransferase [Maricaulis sp.]|jgi:adenine phosphoribosyltransferase|nr:adenine phosphoribosyltransferase [Maricaulis sp.]MDG2044113.1 adenine phosphoribosyltransferase [Maricaulis sp.]